MTASVTPISDGLRQLRRKADGEPRQDHLFAEWAIIPEFWAWVVEIRARISGNVADPLLEGEWTDWVPHWLKPNHFRSQLGAKDRYALLMSEKDFARKIELGLLECRVMPKYIGCIPDKDETWIAD